MTRISDSDKLLLIIKECRHLRRVAIEECIAELEAHGQTADTAQYETPFKVAGAVLGLAGHADDLDWQRDASGADLAASSGPGSSERLRYEVT